MKRLMINCEKATLLLSKKEEGKLTFAERTHLLMHLAMCRFCKEFEKQTTYFSKQTKHFISSKELTTIDKNKMADTLTKK